jgi:uncharacterized membrane protein HdeD (DUF308 family)
MTTVNAPASPTTSTEPLRAKSSWIIALGVVYVLSGLIALSSVVLASVVTVVVVGAMMVVAGVAEILNAFQLRSWGKTFLWILLGVLYVAAGILTIENPLLAAKLLTLILGAALVVSGVMRMVLAFNMKSGTAWYWVVLSGLVTVVVGGVILGNWPVSSLYVLGIFLGFDLVFAGAGWIAAGLGLKART